MTGVQTCALPILQQRLRAATRRAFFPDAADWNELVLARSRQVMRQALAWAGARA